MTLAMTPEVAEALSRLVEKWRGEVATYPDDLMGWAVAAGVHCCANELEDRLGDSGTVQRKRRAGESDADPATSGATSVLRCCAMRAIETASHYRAMHESTAYYVLEGAVLGHSEDCHLPWGSHAFPSTSRGVPILLSRPDGDGGLS